MASHKSAIKKEKQDESRRISNRSHLSRYRTEIKKMRAVIAAGDAAAASKNLAAVESIIDHSATVGVIHRNAAARTKSRIASQVAALPRS
jgi:small subunit ribosomal protein S20